MRHDVFEKLKEDHDQVKNLFKEILDDPEKLSPKERKDLFYKLKSELLAHAKAEEHAFYPNFKLEKGMRPLILEAEVEHSVAEKLIARIDEEDAESDEWVAKVKVLCEIVKHHIKEEEDELFPKAKKIVDSDRSQDLAIVIEQEEKSYKEAV